MRTTTAAPPEDGLRADERVGRGGADSDDACGSPGWCRLTLALALVCAGTGAGCDDNGKRRLVRRLRRGRAAVQHAVVQDVPRDSESQPLFAPAAIVALFGRWSAAGARSRRRDAGPTSGRSRQRVTWLATCLATVLTVTAAACTSGSAPASGTSPATDQAQASERSDDLLERTLSADEPGCSAAVGIEGQVVWAGARGMADLASGQALTTSTTFPIGSTSKQFTATAVLLLEQQGRLALSDPVHRWVPGLPAWAQHVTLEHLLHHTSGVPDYFHMYGFSEDDRSTQQQAIDALAKTEPLSEPGEQYEYSNSNYVLLAEVVRAASGQPLPDFLHERVFQPLDLDMVVDPTARTPTATDPRAARLYVQSGGWQRTGAYGEQIGDGGVQTTPSQLVRWADNYRTGRVGGQRLLDAVVRDPVATHSDLLRYGAGILLSSDGQLRHGGSEAGASTQFSISADRRIAVAVSCNRDHGQAGEAISTALLAEWI